MPTNTTKTISALIVGILLLLGIVLLVAIFGNKTRATKPEYVEIENEIMQYIQNKHLNIRLHSSEYKTFLHDILFGEYPGLVNSQNEKEMGDYILDYLEIPREKEEDLPLAPINGLK